MYQDFFRKYLSANLDAVISMQREAEVGVMQWAKLGGLDETPTSPETATRKTPLNFTAELNSLKEKLKELEKKIGLEPIPSRTVSFSPPSIRETHFSLLCPSLGAARLNRRC